MTTAVSADPHRIDLVNGAILVLSWNGEIVRVAHYRRRKPNDNAPSIETGRFNDLVARNLLPRGLRTDWSRATGKATTLRWALNAVFTADEQRRYAEDVVRYVRSVGWGKDVP